MTQQFNNEEGAILKAPKCSLLLFLHRHGEIVTFYNQKNNPGKKLGVLQNWGEDRGEGQPRDPKHVLFVSSKIDTTKLDNLTQHWDEFQVATLEGGTEKEHYVLCNKGQSGVTYDASGVCPLAPDSL